MQKNVQTKWFCLTFLLILWGQIILDPSKLFLAVHTSHKNISHLKMSSAFYVCCRQRADFSSGSILFAIKACLEHEQMREQKKKNPEKGQNTQIDVN